jgi:tripartite-type tricarboxylate transporter receptor subunit TctC
MSEVTLVVPRSQKKLAETRRHILGGFAMLPFLARPVRAERGFPERPIRIIVPYGPGTGNDTFARQIAARFPKIFGHPAIIDNRPGANAIVGTELAARSAPDGYTLLFGAEQAVCFNPALSQRLTYDPLRDFAPIAGLVSATYVLVVAPGLPVQSVPELIALAKSQPGRLSFGSTGAATASRIIGEVFARDAGIELTSVAYQTGTGQLFADLLTGTVSMMFYPYQFVRAHLQAGRMRALATTGVQRPEWMRDVPTMAELGYRRTIAATSLGVYAPTGTPADRIERLAEIFRLALEEPELRSAFLADGTDIDFTPPAEFASVFAARLDRCRELVALAGVRLD